MKKRTSLLVCLLLCLLTACGGDAKQEGSSGDSMEAAVDTMSADYEAAMEAVLEDGKKLQKALEELDAMFPEE